MIIDDDEVKCSDCGYNGDSPYEWHCISCGDCTNQDAGLCDFCMGRWREEDQS